MATAAGEAKRAIEASPLNVLERAVFLKDDRGTEGHKTHSHDSRKLFRIKKATLIPVDIVEASVGLYEGNDYTYKIIEEYSRSDK